MSGRILRVSFVVFSLIYILTLAHFSSGALSDNLVNYWDGDGTTCEYDEVGGNANLTLQGSAGCVANGKIGQGFRVLGSDTHFINTTNTGAATGAGAGTICAWLNTSSVAAGGKVFWVYGTNSDGQARGHQRDASALKSYRYVNDQTYTGVTLSANTYFYACDVYDGSKSLFYYNGVNTNNYTTTLNTGNLNLYMGRDKFFAGGGFNGTLDEFGVWTRVLTAAEISELYNSGSGRDYSYITSGTALNVITVSLFNNVTNAQISSSVTFSNITGNLNFSFFNITTSGYCVTLTGNGTITNCTAGNGASTYFNTTKTQTITTTDSVVTSTHQANLNITAYRLFLNTSITTFNGTNNQTTNQTTTTNLILKALNGTNNIRLDTPGNYSLNITCTVPTPLTTVACNATGIYDAIITVNATNLSNTVTNFNTSITNLTLGLNQENVTSGPGIVWPVLQGYTYYLDFSKTDLSDANTTITMSNNSVKYTFSVFPAPSVNFTFYDEINDTQIAENMSLEIINSAQSINLTVTNGNRHINLTGLVGWTIFRYYNYQYAQRDYLLNLQAGGFYSVRLYDIILNESQVVTATVTDTGNAYIENATVSLLRYFVGCNCYRTVQMTSTGADGTGIFYVQALDGHYKWSVSYQDTVYYLSTTSEQINSDTRVFVIDLGQNYYAGFETLTSLGYAVTYNDTTDTLSYIFSDTSGLVTGGCLKVTYLSGVEYQTLQNSCTGGTSGSVLVTLPSPNTTTYLYTAVVNTSNTYTPLLTVDTGSVQKPEAYDFGTTGIFLAIGLLVVLVTIFSFSAVATIIVTALGVIVISLLGIMTFTTSFIVGLSVLVLGISLFLMRS